MGPAVVDDGVAVRTQRHVAQAGHGQLLLFWRHNFQRHRGRREGARPPDRDNRHVGGLGELECERQLSAGDMKLPTGELHGLVLGVVDRDVRDVPGAREPDRPGEPGLEAAGRAVARAVVLPEAPQRAVRDAHARARAAGLVARLAAEPSLPAVWRREAGGWPARGALQAFEGRVAGGAAAQLREAGARQQSVQCGAAHADLVDLRCV